MSLPPKYPQDRIMTCAFQKVNTRCIHMSTMDSTVKGGNIAMAILLDFLNHSWEAKVLYYYHHHL